MLVNWKLIDPDNDKVLYQATTRGAAPDWKKWRSLRELTRELFIQSGYQLLADKKLKTVLMAHPKAKKKSAKKKKEPSIAESLFDSLNFNNYRRRAHLGKALSYLSQLKTRVVEYYYQHGRFPSGQESLGIQDSSAVLQSYSIESVEVGGHGELTAYLSGQHFEEGDRISLFPSVDGQHILWSCQSNLKASLVKNMSCSGE